MCIASETKFKLAETLATPSKTAINTYKSSALHCAVKHIKIIKISNNVHINVEKCSHFKEFLVKATISQILSSKKRVQKTLLIEQDAQLSQRDHAAGCVIVFAKSRRLQLGDNILRTL